MFKARDRWSQDPGWLWNDCSKLLYLDFNMREICISVLFKPLITECFSTAESIIQVLTRLLKCKWMPHWKKKKGFLIHMAITQPVLVLQQNACVSRQRVSYTVEDFHSYVWHLGRGGFIFFLWMTENSVISCKACVTWTKHLERFLNSQI